MVFWRATPMLVGLSAWCGRGRKLLQHDAVCRHFSGANPGIDAAATVTVLADEKWIPAGQDLEFAPALCPGRASMSGQSHQGASQGFVLLIHHGHFQLTLAMGRGGRLLGLAAKRDITRGNTEDNHRQHSIPGHRTSRQQEHYQSCLLKSGLGQSKRNPPPGQGRHTVSSLAERQVIESRIGKRGDS